MKVRVLELTAFLLCALIGTMETQTRAANPLSTEAEENKLAREVDDPTAILSQLKFQDLYTPQNFSTTAQTNELQVKIVAPIQTFWFFPFQQLIRPTISMKTLATSAGGSTITEFADIQLFDLFISKWPDPRKTGFGWALGPTFVFPTGRVPKAGNHAWQIGPAGAAVYRGIPHLMLGFLWQEPMSFAYTNSTAKPQSQGLLLVRRLISRSRCCRHGRRNGDGRCHGISGHRQTANYYSRKRAGAHPDAARYDSFHTPTGSNTNPGQWHGILLLEWHLL